MSHMVTPMGQLVLPANARREAWLSARRQGITATDIVKIVGLSPYGNATDVYLSKRLPSDDEAPSEAARWGQLLEDQVAREWALRRGCRVRRVGLLARMLTPHHLASCDRVVTGERAALEVKTRTAWGADEWADGVPERVAIQAQWQLHVTGFDRVHVAALIGGNTLHSATVDRDQVLIDYLISEADRVWDAVLTGTPPAVPPHQQTVEALNRLHPDRAGATEVDPDTARPLLAAYTEAAQAATAAERAKTDAKVALIELLGDADEALINGAPAYTYRASTSTTIPAANARRMLADHPDLAEYAETKTTRRFVPARRKD